LSGARQADPKIGELLEQSFRNMQQSWLASGQSLG
jgi:hypothetical protein